MQVFYSKLLHERVDYHVCLLQKYLWKKSAELWLVITGYSVIIAIVYLCNGEMDACYEIKDSQFIDIPNTIDSKVRING